MLRCHILLIISILLLPMVGCEEGARQTPPTVDPSISLTNPQPKSITVLVDTDSKEHKVFSSTIINDQMPTALQPTDDADAPKREVTGAYRVDAPLSYQRTLPADYDIAVTRHHEHIVHMPGLQALHASRFVLISPGKKLADGMTILRNRRASEQSAYSEETLLFFEKANAKDAGQWKIRTLAGEEVTLDVGEVSAAKLTIVDSDQGYFLLQRGGDNGGKGYLLVKAADQSVVTICKTGCDHAQFVPHASEGMFISYQDVSGEGRPLMLVSADLAKQWTVARDPDMAEGETLTTVAYRGFRFLPSGEFLFARRLEKHVADQFGDTVLETVSLLTLSDSVQRVVAEHTQPSLESIVISPQAQREVKSVVAVIGEQVLAETADTLYSLSGKKPVAEPIAGYLTLLGKDGARTDLVSTEGELSVVHYWAETNRVALHVQEAVPTITVVRADTGAVELELKDASPLRRVQGNRHWPFVIIGNESGQATKTQQLEVIGPYLDRAILGTLQGNVAQIIVTDVAADAAPTRTADETTVPQLTLEAQPVSVAADPTSLTGVVQITAASPFDAITGHIECDTAQAQPSSLPGSSDFTMDVTITLQEAADAHCTVTANDQFKKISAEFVVQYVAPTQPVVQIAPKGWTAAHGLFVIPVAGADWMWLSSTKPANGMYTLPGLSVSGSKEEPKLSCQGGVTFGTQHFGENIYDENTIYWYLNANLKKSTFPANGTECTFTVTGAAPLTVTVKP